MNALVKLLCAPSAFQKSLTTCVVIPEFQTQSFVPLSGDLSHSRGTVPTAEWRVVSQLIRQRCPLEAEVASRQYRLAFTAITQQPLSTTVARTTDAESTTDD